MSWFLIRFSLIITSLDVKFSWKLLFLRFYQTLQPVSMSLSCSDVSELFERPESVSLDLKECDRQEVGAAGVDTVPSGDQLEVCYLTVWVSVRRTERRRCSVLVLSKLLLLKKSFFKPRSASESFSGVSSVLKTSSWPGWPPSLLKQRLSAVWISVISPWEDNQPYLKFSLRKYQSLVEGVLQVHYCSL